MGGHLDSGVGGSFSSPPDKEMLMCCLCSIGFQLSTCQPPYYQIGWQFNEPPPPACTVAGNTWLKLCSLPYCRPLEHLCTLHKNRSLVRPTLLTSVTCCSPDSLCLGRTTACQFFLSSPPPGLFVLESYIFIYLHVCVCVPLLRDMQRTEDTFLGWLINPQLFYPVEVFRTLSN